MSKVGSRPAATSAGVPYEMTLHVRDHCLCLATRRAARTLSRHFDEVLRPVGLTNGQFSLLMSLNRPEPPAMGSVAALLAMDRTTLTANLKPLERNGLVVTRVDPDDRRGRRLLLTPAGHKALRAATPIWERTHAELDRLLAGIALDPAVLRQGLRALA